MYGYELITSVSKVVDLSDGTIYPILKRLTMDRYVDTYLEESTEGPPRKYYKINELGQKHAEELEQNWSQFSIAVNKFIKECNDER